tara:strand:- start:112 stop:252 length:141 start_codon:yes stop_codon:yes gene_type:complete
MYFGKTTVTCCLEFGFTLEGESNETNNDETTKAFYLLESLCCKFKN